MPIKTWEIRQDRHDLLNKGRAILDACEKEGRDLTVSERTAYNELRTKARRLSDEIALGEEKNDLEREEAERELRRRDGDTSGGPMFRNHDTGEYVRGVKHGQSFRTASGLRESNARLGKLIFGAVTGDWRGADEERAMYAQGTNASGGFLLTPQMSAGVIDLARAKSVMSTAGCVTIPMQTEEMKVALVESDPTAYWTAEGATITESQGTFGAVELRSRSLAVYCEAPLELVRNASNAQTIIENTFTSALGLGLDAAILNGTGAGEEPTGLLYSSQVTNSAAAGPFTYDKLIDAMALCWAGNVEPNAWVMEDSLRKYVAKVKDGEGLYLPPPPEAAALKRFTSTQLQSATANGTCYVGDFSNCLIGIRSGIEIEASGVSGTVFQKKKVAIRGLMFADFAVGRSGDVVKMTGITGL